MDALTLRFHSLNGTKIQEKRKDFNLFLKSLESDTNRLTEFISSIKPNNSTEELFRIELLLHFKQYDLLKKELMTNSALLVRKLLKNWELFGELFSSINAQTLVHDIFPYISYSLKLKLLNGICKNVKSEILLDEYFLILEKKYGLKTASILLPGCTLDLIKSKTAKCHIKLNSKQLITIFKKDKQFVEYYLDIIHDEGTSFYLIQHHNQTLKYIAAADAHLYWKLDEKYKLHMKFGKHMTSKMFRANAKVLNDDITNIHDFHRRQLYKTIRKDGNLREFLFNVYPETIEGLSNRLYDLSFLIKLFPKHQSYSIIMSICKEKYGKNLLDYPEYCDEDFIRLMPVKERENILDVLVKNDEELLYLYQTSKSIPIIKNRLQHSSDWRTRSHLISLMYKTCNFNEDKEALLEVLHFVVNRYKNDVNMVTAIFNNVMNWPRVITLEEKYWKYLADMVKIIEIIKKNYYLGDFYIKYICHFLEYNIPCQDKYKQFIKHLLKQAGGGFYWSIDTKYEKQFIKDMGENIPAFKKDKNYKNLCLSFLSYLAEYNNRAITAQIPYNYYSNLFDQIELLNYCYNSEIAIHFGLKSYQTEFWHNLFWKYHENTNMNYGILSWYLKNNPEKVAQNLNIVLNRLNAANIQRFAKLARIFLDEDALKEIEVHALNNLQGTDKNKIKHAFKIISNLKPESMSEVVLPLLIEPDVETNTKKYKETSVLQQVLIKKLHKLGKPLDIFPLISKFCNRYHYISALSPLQSVAYRVPEQHVQHHLMQLSNKVLSIRKQILILAKNLLAQDSYVTLLEEFCEKETNISVKNIIFQKTLQHFIENPSDSLWILTQKNFKLLDKENGDVFNDLLNFEKIPRECLPHYIEFIFEEISNNANHEIKEKRLQLLDSIPSTVIDILKTEFLTNVIVDTACREKISNFHWKCAFYTSGEKQKLLFDRNVETLKDFIEENRLKLNKDPAIRTVIIGYFYRFLDIAIELERGGNLIEKFISSWTSILQPNSFCKEYTILIFTNLYFKSNFDATQTGIEINSFLCNYINKYSPSIIPIFSKHLKEFLDKIGINKREQIMKFIEGFIDREDNENIFLVVIHILAEISKMEPIDYYRINSNIKKIEICANPVVKFHYNMYLVRN